MSDGTKKPGGGMRIRLLKRGRVVKSYKVKPDTFTIGSGKEATIRAANVQGLAPKHALVWLDEGVPTLVPSAGCTVVVNGQDVQFARLAPTDTVSIGKLELQISAVEAPPSSVEQGMPDPGVGALPPIDPGPDDDGPTVVSSPPVDPITGASAGSPRPPQPGPAFEPPRAPPPAAHPFPAAFEPPKAPPPAAAAPPDTGVPLPSHDDFDDDAETMVSRPVYNAGDESPAASAPARPAPQPEIEHKPTTMGVPLPRVPGHADSDSLDGPTDEFSQHPAFAQPPSAEAVAPRAAPAERSPAPPAMAPPSEPSPAARAEPLMPEPPLPGDYYGDWDDDDDEDDEFDFVEPFSLADVLEQSGPPETSGAREKYVVAQVTRHSEGKVWRVVTVQPGGDYRPDPADPPLLKMTKDGRALVSIAQGVMGRVTVGGQETPLSNFQSGPGGTGQATLSNGDHAVIDTPNGRFIIHVFRPPRAATPRLVASMVALGVLGLYAIGVLGVLGGLLFALSGYIVPEATPGDAASDEERYELISQNDLTLIAPQNVDTPDEEPVETDEVEDAEQQQEVPPETVPRTTRRRRHTSSSSGSSSAASQLISALTSSGGGGGASLQDVITNIDAVGSTSAGSALFRTSGIISKLPGGDVKIARRGGAGGVATIGGSALKASSPGLGSLKSTGRAGKVRGRVSRVSSLMRASGGRLDRGAVLRVINRHIGAITRCYERRLVANPGLSGRIVFSWRVSESGRVGGVSVRSSTIADAQVASCISGVIRRMRFPEPEGGAVNISFPFVFRAVDF